MIIVIVAGLVDKVIVIYTGFIVESAPVCDLYAYPNHPYTRGLLRSLPRVDKDRRWDERLISITSQPLDLLGLPAGCPFAPRCPHVEERCLTGTPTLREIAPAMRSPVGWILTRFRHERHPRPIRRCR